ncbi:lysoplasmalogenase-like protein TMEM86A [Hyalella azteca]|uniref:lysoplasmalogenase n=1 Tax=Hyalella azteca TaxID=294128 RepID=A0A8B7NBU1_HYAAZ|nr:lysoplasmalogenase-like protein TMEM86A [Hyalella azteca]XP_047739579.1 lysoplasmalogenase-like protein TMEM86A [Hyalella azteca]
MTKMEEYQAVAVLSSCIAVPYLALQRDPSALAVLVKILPCLFFFLHLCKKHSLEKRGKIESSFQEALLELLGLGSNAPGSQKQQRSTPSKQGGGHAKKAAKELRRDSLRTGVARGLVFSLIGDAFLVWIDEEAMFLIGMLAFGVAQLWYIKGLGFVNVNYLRGVGLYVSLLAVTAFLLRDSPLTFRIAVPFYALLLITSLWRAIDRCGEDDGRSAQQRRSSALGAAVFVASDTCIAVTKFAVAVNPAIASAAIHTTYYLAQALITLGAA